MKQKFLATILAGMVALSAGAQKTDDLLVNAGNFKNISIAENMNVVLITAAEPTANFTVSQAAAQQLNITLSGETLKLDAKRYSKKSTVYVTVAGLQVLSLGENSVVRVDGILTTPELQLFVDSNTKAYLKTRGKINAQALSDTEVTIEKITGKESIAKVL
jgi:hypothetical protein